MSLTPDELARTRAELQANLALTGLTIADVAADLGVDARAVESTLSSGAADPVAVWQLRDYLQQAVRDCGGSPVPFTILTDRAKQRARVWFPLLDAPRHDFGA